MMVGHAAIPMIVLTRTNYKINVYNLVISELPPNYSIEVTAARFGRYKRVPGLEIVAT